MTKLRFLIWPAASHLAHTWRTPGAPLNSSSAHSCRTPVALLSHSCRTPVALLSHSCRTPVALLSHSCRTPVSSRGALLAQRVRTPLWWQRPRKWICARAPHRATKPSWGSDAQAELMRTPGFLQNKVPAKKSYYRKTRPRLGVSIAGFSYRQYGLSPGSSWKPYRRNSHRRNPTSPGGLSPGAS